LEREGKERGMGMGKKERGGSKKRVLKYKKREFLNLST